MKKFLMVLVAIFAFSGISFAAVDLNKATQAELEALKGIGPAKAKAIIDYRTKNGAFKSADDLDKVKGVGKGVMAKIANEVTIDGKSLQIPAAATKPAEKSTGKKMEAPAAAAPTAAPADEKAVKMDEKKKK
ncbi:MAG: helix-hairpin-helix domain-containing protein [Burkholderiales bacterium]